jgi:HlyD family secretion protein
MEPQATTLMRKALILILLVLAIAGGIWLFQGKLQDPPPGWRLAQVERGTIEQVISATGRVDPVMTVDISSQVSGQIAEVLVNFNSKVATREVLARIDPAVFQARVEVARADLAYAQANVAMQKAVLDELRAERSGATAALDELDRNLKRQRILFQRKVVSESVVGSALAQRDQARARLESIAARLVKQQAQVRSAKAQVDSRSGSLRERELDLGYTVILSPVDGVVINRDVDVGQTVAASLQAPVLFTLAKDLRDVQIEVSVDEADIGRVINGQQVRFTVDAYPDRRFSGHVAQVRKAPQVDSGVVTYRVMVATRNNDEALLPGMTATVEIIVGRRENILRVPNSALRFKPEGVSKPSGSMGENGHQRAVARVEKLTTALELSDEQRSAVAAVFREMGESIRALRESGMAEQARKNAKTQFRNQAVNRIEALLSEDQRVRYREMRVETAATRKRRGMVWQPDGPTPVKVEIGLSDDSYSEITSNKLSAGDTVITGRERAAR